MKCHPFFSGFDWENIDTMKAYYIPTIREIKDTSNFARGSYKMSHDPFINKLKHERRDKKRAPSMIILDSAAFNNTRQDLLNDQNMKSLRQQSVANDTLLSLIHEENVLIQMLDH